MRLKNVATIINGAENAQLGALSGVTPAVILNVQRQPGANVIATTDAIKRQLPELQAALPGNVQVDVLADRTAGIRASVEHVETEPLEIVVHLLAQFLG